MGQSAHHLISMRTSQIPCCSLRTRSALTAMSPWKRGEVSILVDSLPRFEAREPDMYRLLRAIGSLLSRYLNRQTLGAYLHPAADLALMSQILKPADVVLVERQAPNKRCQGGKYDLKNVFDRARYLLPTPPVPTPWRRQMLTLGSSDPTRAICSTLIAEAFETVGLPILPIVGSKATAGLGCPDRVTEVQHIRHYRLFVPRDFDVSPYFTIIKPNVCRDYRSLASVDDESTDREGQAPARSSIAIAHAKGTHKVKGPKVGRWR